MMCMGMTRRWPGNCSRRRPVSVPFRSPCTDRWHHASASGFAGVLPRSAQLRLPVGDDDDLFTVPHHGTEHEEPLAVGGDVEVRMAPCPGHIVVRLEQDLARGNGECRARSDRGCEELVPVCVEDSSTVAGPDRTRSAADGHRELRAWTGKRTDDNLPAARFIRLVRDPVTIA